MVLIACSPEEFGGSDVKYCGHSFCIAGVSEQAVTVTMPVIDVRRYEIRTPQGVLRLVESNFPDIDELEQETALDLPNLKAWHLSPTPRPLCLVFVGAKWPHWMLAWIDGENVERKDLVEYLRRVRITATASTSMEGIDFPVGESPNAN